MNTEPEKPNRIAELRKAAGVSQEQLAAKMNTGRSTVVKLERGERPLTQEWMNRIAVVIGCQPWQLLPGAPDMGPRQVRIQRALATLEGPRRERVEAAILQILESHSEEGAQ